MNREIKFRGKRIDNGEWVYGGYHKHIKRQISPIGDSLQDDDIAHLIIQSGFADWNIPKPLHGIEVIPETVGQYTGLKDKNGKEIYEGDIVCDRWANFYTPIFRNGIYMAYNVKDLHLTKQEPSTQFNVIWKNGCEVIGNIYENPELLEVEND